MKKLKMVIIIFVIIILLLILILLNNYYSENKKEDASLAVRDISVTQKIPLEKEESIGTYMLIDEMIDNFFLHISQNNENINNAEAAYFVLDEEYINENSITKDNVLTFFEKYRDYNSYSTKNMYNKKITESEGMANVFYYIKGVLRMNGQLEYVYILLKEDSLNQTYSIQFLDENQFNTIIEDSTNVDIEEFEIENKEYNQLYVKTTTDYDICLKHMEDYKNALNNNVEEAYVMLDEEYKEKRFGSLENFEIYREEKQETFGNENFVQYLVNDYDTYKQYVCKDQFGNLYIFEETYPMEYTLKLDTYTIMTDKFKQEYDNGSDQTKVQMNIDKFILMINNQDYEAAYNVLDDNFKNNYFNTLDEFKQYVQNNMYRYNDLSFESFDVNGNIYSCTVKLTDLSEGKYVDETKGTGGSGYIYTWNFVMQLKDNYEFTLSFEVI